MISADRDLLSDVRNQTANDSLISRYEYEDDNAGYRENVVNTGSAFSSNAHTTYAYNGPSGSPRCGNGWDDCCRSKCVS